VYSVYEPVFRRKVSPPSSGSKISLARNQSVTGDSVNTYCNSIIQIIQREIHIDHMKTRFGYKGMLQGNWIENIFLNYGPQGGTILKDKQKIEW
jgi:hypothetical protein